MNLRQKTLFALLFILGIIGSGCRIEFDAKSVVRRDGSIERTTSYKAQESSDKDEILSRYELPAGGKWNEATVPIYKFLKKDTVDQMTSVYTTTRVIPPNAQPATDFKRFSEKRERFASNSFSVHVSESFFSREYDYEETFKDTLDTAKVKQVIDRIITKGLTTFRTQLDARSQDKAFVDAVVKQADETYGELVRSFYTLVSAQGWDVKKVEDLSNQMEEKFTPEAAGKIMSERLPQYDKEEYRKTIGEAFHATQPILDDYLSNDQELQAERDQIFGIHGLNLFQYYDFGISVKMPGTILDTNADQTSGNTLSWKFDSSGLSRTLHARSRTILRRRLAAAGFFFLLLLLLPVFLLAAGRNKKKKSRRPNKTRPANDSA